MAERSEIDICAICLGEKQNPTNIACGHSFCSTCLETLVRVAISNTCPLCRQSFEYLLDGVDTDNVLSDATQSDDNLYYANDFYINLLHSPNSASHLMSNDNDEEESDSTDNVTLPDIEMPDQSSDIIDLTTDNEHEELEVDDQSIEEFDNNIYDLPAVPMHLLGGSNDADNDADDEGEDENDHDDSSVNSDESAIVIDESEQETDSEAEDADDVDDENENVDNVVDFDVEMTDLENNDDDEDDDIVVEVVSNETQTSNYGFQTIHNSIINLYSDSEQSASDLQSLASQSFNQWRNVWTNHVDNSISVEVSSYEINQSEESDSEMSQS